MPQNTAAIKSYSTVCMTSHGNCVKY